jgi:hypothetical protein
VDRPTNTSKEQEHGHVTEGEEGTGRQVGGVGITLFLDVQPCLPGPGRLGHGEVFGVIEGVVVGIVFFAGEGGVGREGL